jgi:lipoyl(octanoyl) transferase
MNLSFINHGSNTGRYNMDYDLELLERSTPEEGFIRLYRWLPYTISLGANQEEGVIDVERVKEAGYDIVKRPTGGRGVLHSEELTYSVVMCIEMGKTAKQIYKEINEALLKGLSFYDVRVAARLEEEQINFNSFYKDSVSAACFAAPAKCEVKVNGKKLIGSAQKKQGDKILQHGSILCGDHHKKIIDYLRIEEGKKEELRRELDEKTEDLENALKDKVDYERLRGCIIKGFSEFYNINYLPESIEEKV